jgi:hypothetical protein
MIVLHSHQVIFLKPRKVAGTSFEIALSNYAAEDDILTPITPKDEELRRSMGFRGAQNYNKRFKDILARPTRRDLKNLVAGRKPQLFYNHIAARDARARVGPAVWDQYTKVSIVRNPFDCAVSQYFWDNKRIPVERRPSFAQWCMNNQAVLGRNNEQYMIDGKTIIDIFVRYENFEEDIRALEQAIPGLAGLYGIFSLISAKGTTRPKQGASVQDMFTDAESLENLIRQQNRYEIERFGYSLHAARGTRDPRPTSASPGQARSSIGVTARSSGPM